MVPNAVQCTRTLVLLLPRVLGQGDDWCEHSAATSLSLSSCQEGLLAFQLCLCSSRLVGAQLSIPGSQLATVCQCRLASLAAIGSSPARRRRHVVKGSQGSVGLLGARGGQRRGSGFSHPKWLVGSHKLLQNSLAVSSRALGERCGGGSDSGESLMGLWANQPIGSSKGHIIKLLRIADTNLHHLSKFYCKNAVKPQINPVFFTACKSNRYPHNTSHESFPLPPLQVHGVFLVCLSSQHSLLTTRRDVLQEEMSQLRCPEELSSAGMQGPMELAGTSQNCLWAAPASPQRPLQPLPSTNTHHSPMGELLGWPGGKDPQQASLPLLSTLTPAADVGNDQPRSSSFPPGTGSWDCSFPSCPLGAWNRSAGSLKAKGSGWKLNGYFYSSSAVSVWVHVMQPYLTASSWTPATCFCDFLGLILF